MKKISFKKISTCLVMVAIMVCSCFAFVGCDKKSSEPTPPTKAEALAKIKTSVTKINSLLTKDNTGKISITMTDKSYTKTDADWDLIQTSISTDIKVGNKFYEESSTQDNETPNSEPVIDCQNWVEPNTTSSKGYYSYDWHEGSDSKVVYNRTESDIEDFLYKIDEEYFPQLTTVITEEKITSVTLDDDNNVVVVAKYPESYLNDSETTEPEATEDTIDLVFTIKGDDIVSIEISEILETDKFQTSFGFAYGNEIAIPTRNESLWETTPSANAE